MRKGILIKYGEITLKGNNRSQFENVLIKDIRSGLKELGHLEISKEQGRLFIGVPEMSKEGVFMNEEAQQEWLSRALDQLQKVFGIIGICPVDVLDNDSIETICQAAVEYVKREYDRPETFKVFAKRANKRYPLNSMEIAATIGEAILDSAEGWTVDVHDPKVKIYAEIRNQVYVYGKELKGLGGLPVGTGGKATLLLSGGIDSPVAGWMMAKRGVQLSAVYFHAHPYTSDRARDKVLELARRVSIYSGPIPVYVVPFTQIQLDIYEKCQHEKLTVIMRRLMYRVAEKIADKEGAQAMITGENLGQVASQTLAALTCTNDAADRPVFRPLIAFDKQQIVEIAKSIDTFETSILPYEDCCTIFVAKHPTTQPKLSDILENEALLGDIEAQIQKAANESELYLCRPEGIKKVLTEAPSEE